MPTMASIVVKKADGTTDITYDSLSPSGGDGTPAMWRQDTGQAAGFPAGLRPMFRLSTKWNGPRTARVASFELTRPYATQDTTTTIYSSKDQTLLKGSMTLPVGIPPAELKEAVYQHLNLLASALVKSSLETGFAPR